MEEDSQESAYEEVVSEIKPVLRHRPLFYYSILGVVIVVILVITFLIEKPTDPEDYLRSSGYVGVLITSIIGSTGTPWPLPGSWAVFLAAGPWIGLNPILLGLVAGIGEPIGESAAYMGGYGGQAAVSRIKGYAKVERWMKRRGGIILFLLAAIPNVLIKAAVVCAGALKYPFRKFFLICWAGKTIKSFFFAFTGYYFFDALYDLFDKWL